jgi:hypothetical protein
MPFYFDDRLAFFNEFAQTVTLGDIEQSRSFKAIFDNKANTVNGGGVESWSTSEPQLLCRDEDIAGIEQLDRITLTDGKRYQVSDTQPDGTGITRLFLHEEVLNDLFD